MKKVLSVILALSMIFSFCLVSSAASEKQQKEYKSYVLLGDSIAAGWSDLEEKDTSLTRVEGSYGALLADDLGAEYHPYACIGFRTHEIRYMFEDDFVGDEFMFYSIDKSRVDAVIPEIRQAVADADLITLNVGGNDWGSYVGWHVERAVAEMSGTENFVEMALPYLENTVNFNIDTIETLVGMADLAQCLPELAAVLPFAIKEGFEHYIKNWNIMIEDIYALNPDVTLVVIGMFDNSVQDETMDNFEGDYTSSGFVVPSVEIAGINIGQTVVDLANTPMREGAEKYGYIFVDPVGTLCEVNHPSAKGHRHIADLILEALPDANFPYEDVALGSDYYAAVEYMYKNNIMDGASATSFGVDEKLTKADLAAALYNLAGKPEVTASAFSDIADADLAAAATWAVENGLLKADGDKFEPEDKINTVALARILYKAEKLAEGSDFLRSINTLVFFFRTLVSNFAILGNNITRGDAAKIIYSYAKLF